MHQRYDFPLLSKNRNVDRTSLGALSTEEMKAHKPLIVQIPVHALTNGCESLSDVVSRPLRWTGVRQIILTLAHLCDNPYLCMVPEEDERGRPLPPGNGPEWRSRYQEIGFDGETGDAVVTPRVATLFEVVRDTQNVILAYRFYFLNQDARMDWDRGIQALCDSASPGPARQKKKGFFIPPAQPWECFPQSAAQWVEDFLTCYDSKKATHQRYKAYELTNEAYGACAHKFLNLKRCFEHCEPWEKSIRPEQVNETKYRDTGTGEYIFPFPEDVYIIPPDFVSASVFFHARFPHLAPKAMAPPPNCPDFDPYLEQRLEMVRLKAMGNGAPGSRERVNGFDVLREVNAERIRDMTPEQVLQWSSEPNTLATFAAAWHSGGGLNTIRTIAEWGAKNKTLISHDEVALDPLLSPQANFILNRMEALEKVYICKNMHVTLLATWLCVLTSLCPKRDLKNNALLTGAAATGKSFIMNVLYDFLCIAGTILKVSHITECALKTESDFNFVTLMYDEMPNKMLGINKDGKVDGTGDPFLKTLMTDQRVDVVSFELTEEGKRIASIIKNPMVVGFVGGSNAAKHLIPDALATRYWAHDCIEFPRKYHEVANLKKAVAYSEVDNASKMARLRERHSFEFQKLQYILTMVEQLIHVHMLPDVDTTVAMELFEHVTDFFSTRGFPTAQERHHIRLRNAARALTIVQAAHLVFNTDRVFDPNAKAKIARAERAVEEAETSQERAEAEADLVLLRRLLARALEWYESTDADISTKPFEFRDVLEVRPYLVCTEETAAFVLTAFSDMFVNTNESIPINALVCAHAGYKPTITPEQLTDGTVKFRTLTDGKFDPNYIAITDVHVNIQQQETLESAVAALAQAALEGDARMSIESITDVVHALARRSMKCDVVYTGVPGVERAIVESRPAVPVSKRIIDVVHSTRCVYILRQYVDFVRTTQYQNLMDEAIKSYEHRHIRPRKVVTGTSWITGDHSGVSMPQFLHLVEWNNGQDKRCMKIGRVGLGDTESTSITNVNMDLEEARTHMYLRDKCNMHDAAMRSLYTPRGLELWQYSQHASTNINAHAYPKYYMERYRDVEKQMHQGLETDKGFAQVSIARNLDDLIAPGHTSQMVEHMGAKRHQTMTIYGQPVDKIPGPKVYGEAAMDDNVVHNAYGVLATVPSILSRQTLEASGVSEPLEGETGITDFVRKRVDENTSTALKKRLNLDAAAAATPEPPQQQPPQDPDLGYTHALVDSGMAVVGKEAALTDLQKAVNASINKPKVSAAARRHVDPMNRAKDLIKKSMPEPTTTTTTKSRGKAVVMSKPQLVEYDG